MHSISRINLNNSAACPLPIPGGNQWQWCSWGSLASYGKTEWCYAKISVFTSFVSASKFISCTVCLSFRSNRMKMSNSLLESLMFLK